MAGRLQPVKVTILKQIQKMNRCRDIIVSLITMALWHCSGTGVDCYEAKMKEGFHSPAVAGSESRAAAEMGDCTRHIHVPRPSGCCAVPNGYPAVWCQKRRERFCMSAASLG